MTILWRVQDNALAVNHKHGSNGRVQRDFSAPLDFVRYAADLSDQVVEG